jgi:hypothetical protein
LRTLMMSSVEMVMTNRYLVHVVAAASLAAGGQGSIVRSILSRSRARHSVPALLPSY